MSGIINNTAARSGVIGTTVGTPVATDASALVTGTLPMARLSGVLPSAVTGGSGLTALGTVTAGNLSNTSIVYPAGHTKVTTLTNNTETSLSNATSHYETIGSHAKSVASSIITAHVLLPIHGNTSDAMYSVPILSLQYGGTASAVQTGTVTTGGIGPQMLLYGTWTGKGAGNHDLKWGWNFDGYNSRPGITTWNPDETVDHRMTQSATYAIVMEIFA